MLHAEQDLPGARAGDRGFLEAEVGCPRLPVRSGGKDDLAGPGCRHVDCLHKSAGRPASLIVSPG